MRYRYLVAIAALVLITITATPAAAATHYVANGFNLQAALDAAQPGDEVVLQAGATFVGTFRLPVKPAGPSIVVRSSVLLEARRVTPLDASKMATLVSPTVEPALMGQGTSNWRIDGVRFGSTKDGMYNVVHLQDATNIVLDRILLE